jgi:S-methyl-5-thioribose-1-phosphate isomerase
MSSDISFESLKYNRGKLSVIDQLKLPTEISYINVATKEEAWEVIRKMQVRGAPLIAIVAALGIAVDVESKRNFFNTNKEAYDYLSESMSYLRTSRPTAVNLFRATDELLSLINKLINEENSTSNTIIDGYILTAEKMLIDDIKSNKAIGDYGAKRILEITKKESIKVLTICNTGSLATAGYGTALGVVRSLHAMGKLEHVYACETRPYNQGARLTSFEIVQDKLPGTLIADSMAASLMAVKGIDCVVVGADRVTANGDTANKIGTYQLAIAAKFHGIPFFTAAPTTTLDLSMSCGAEIFVEERAGNELTSIFGQKIAPEGIKVWNPAFDVTPCSLITGVITEIGVAETDENSIDGIIDLPTFLSKNEYKSDVAPVIPTAVPPGYIKMDLDNILKYAVNISSIRSLLDIKDNSNESISELTVKEIGDGNLNFVYIIESKSGKKVIAKQALPYIRCIGESWPLSVSRASFECKALQEERKYAEEYVPEVYYFDASKCLICKNIDIFYFIYLLILLLLFYSYALYRNTSYYFKKCVDARPSF